MIEYQPQERTEIFAKLDRLWDNDVDYLEQLFGMIEEADVKSKSWRTLVSEFESILYHYDEWSKRK